MARIYWSQPILQELDQLLTCSIGFLGTFIPLKDLSTALCLSVIALNFSLRTRQHFIDSVNFTLWAFLSCYSFVLPLQTAQGGGHRTLLYGHAILLRHSYSGMVSRCWVLSPMWLCRSIWAPEVRKCWK